MTRPSIITFGLFLLVASCSSNKEAPEETYASKTNLSQQLDLNLPNKKNIYFDIPVELEVALKLLEENGATFRQINVFQSPITKPRTARQDSDKVYIVGFPEISLDHGNIVLHLYVKDNQVHHAKVEVGFVNPY